MNVPKILGYAAVGGLLVLAVPAERAQAFSLMSRRCCRGGAGCKRVDHRGEAGAIIDGAGTMVPSSLASPPLAPLVNRRRGNDRAGP